MPPRSNLQSSNQKMLSMLSRPNIQHQNTEMRNLGHECHSHDEQLHGRRQRYQSKPERCNLKNKITTKCDGLSSRDPILLKHRRKMHKMCRADSLLEHFERNMHEMRQVQRGYTSVRGSLAEVRHERGGLLRHYFWRMNVNV